MKYRVIVKFKDQGSDIKTQTFPRGEEKTDKQVNTENFPHWALRSAQASSVELDFLECVFSSSV